MIPELLKKRLRKDRPMVSVHLRVPEDVVESMERIAALKGLTGGHQALMKTYLSDGLRQDEARHVFSVKKRVEDALLRRGVPREKVEAIVRDAALNRPLPSLERRKRKTSSWKRRMRVTMARRMGAEPTGLS